MQFKAMSCDVSLKNCFRSAKNIKFYFLFSWWTGNWQVCTTSCKNSMGFRKRSVLCVYNSNNSSDVSEMIPVSDSECANFKRPISVEVCSGNFNCSEDPYWITGEWTQVLFKPIFISRQFFFMLL
jgi:hypothetical protein